MEKSVEHGVKLL